MRARRNEEGASLLLVIIFVTVFGLITGVILDFANTGFKATEQTTKIRNEQQAIASAMDSAINTIRGSSSVGYDGEDCDLPPYQKDELMEGDAEGLNGAPVEITCAAGGQSVGGGLPGEDDVPTYAVLAVGTASGDGFRGIGGDANGIAVAGGIHSNSVIDPGGGSRILRVFGDAAATGACPPSTRLLLTGLLGCPAPTQIGAPAYPSAATSTAGMPVPQPGIPCAGGVATFSPGLYTEQLYAATPNAAYLTSFCPIWHLQPGTYYFDLPAGQNVEVPSGVTLVGGTRSGDTCGAEQPGVQLIFGGETRLVVNGSIEACAGPNQGGGATQQRIVVYGLTSGSRCGGGPWPCLVEQPLTVRLPIASPSFGNSGAIVQQDGNLAIANLNGDGQQDASMGSLSSGGPALPFFNPLPAGTTVGRVFIEVSHAEQGDLWWKLHPKVTVKVGNRQHVFEGSDLHTGGMWTERLDITDLVPDLIRPQFGWLDVNAIEVTYSVDANDLNGTTCNGATPPVCQPPETAQAQVDNITLRVEQTAPGFEAHRCAGGGLECSIFDNTGSGGASKAVLRGTVFTPTAALDVAARAGLTRFQRGVIAKRVSVTPQNDIPAASPVFSVPGFKGDSSTNTGRVVVLTATVGGNPRLRVRVEFDDSVSPENPAGLPGATVKVESWSWL